MCECCFSCFLAPAVRGFTKQHEAASGSIWVRVSRGGGAVRHSAGGGLGGMKARRGSASLPVRSVLTPLVFMVCVCVRFSCVAVACYCIWF